MNGIMRAALPYAKVPPPGFLNDRLPFKVCHHAGVAGRVSVLARCSKQSWQTFGRSLPLPFTYPR